MYAVIFTATINVLDEEYFTMAEHLRELALNQYGCEEFSAYTEGNKEVAISVWKSEEDILAWRLDPLHQRAQLLGKEKWYRDYRVRVTRIVRDY